MRNAPPSRCGSSMRVPARSPTSIAREHEPDHERLVVDAADQVEQHERVADAEPQREPDVHPAAPGEPRQRPDDEGEPGQRQHAVGEDAEDDVVAGERGDAASDDEEERAVGGGGVAPDRGDRADERIVDAQAARGAEHVGVDAARELGALGEVAVDVAGEQRRRERQRHRPGGRGARQLGDRRRGRDGAVGAQHLRHPQPRQHHQHDARVGDGDGERDVAAGQPDQPQPEGRVGHRQRARAQAAHGHQQRGDEAEPPRTSAGIGRGDRADGRWRPVQLRCHHAWKRSERGPTAPRRSRSPGSADGRPGGTSPVIALTLRRPPPLPAAAK